MTEKNLLKLDTNSIAHIVKLLQVAILSGTDITDHFRNLSFELVEDTITISEVSENTLNNTIQEMLSKSKD
jgi:hypothetical protein